MKKIYPFWIYLFLSTFLFALPQKPSSNPLLKRLIVIIVPGMIDRVQAHLRSGDISAAEKSALTDLKLVQSRLRKAAFSGIGLIPVLNNLAVIRVHQNRLEESSQLLSRTIKDGQREIDRLELQSGYNPWSWYILPGGSKGSEQIKYLLSLCLFNLATVYRLQGNTEDAGPLEAKALKWNPKLSSLMQLQSTAPTTPKPKHPSSPPPQRRPSPPRPTPPDWYPKERSKIQIGGVDTFQDKQIKG
ncbi:tetratricopeptide repeat protein [Candidatus Methylacidiphilum fumarolicum]|uniref:tetratricopeptide repeat protein n=1 Tax=Candidatus Methylacidiphilum fumarolicum TaxID=591154 RepID=UPI00031F5BAE|nr:tetratricopeptide repeat protein [Candidatus Methylacidiphilum fumarolicum]